MRRRAASMQARIFALVIAAAGLMWLGAASLAWVDTRHELDELLDAHLAQAASLLVAQQVPDFEEERRMDAPVLHRYAPRVAFQVFHEGRLVMGSVNAPAQPMIEPARIGTNQFRSITLGGEPWRVFATRGAADDTLVLVAEDMHARGSILEAVLRSALGPLLAGVPLLAVALWWGVRRGLRPVHEIGRALATRKADDFSPVERKNAPAEMQPMLDSLDHLLARIAALLQSERRFTADASHELRTPLSAIRAQAQVAMAEPDPQLRRHALEATLEACDRAARLVEQLLALSRLDASAASQLDLLDLQMLTRTALSQVAGGAIAKGQQLHFDASEGPCRIAGEPALLSVLLRNLVDNAIRYAPPGATLHVRITRDSDETVLVVENSGAMPPADAMARLGERFFRVLGTGESGSGLGLSIVKRIAELHGARLDYSRSHDLGGLRVAVSFRSA